MGSQKMTVFEPYYIFYLFLEKKQAKNFKKRELAILKEIIKSEPNLEVLKEATENMYRAVLRIFEGNTIRENAHILKLLEYPLYLYFLILLCCHN